MRKALRVTTRVLLLSLVTSAALVMLLRWVPVRLTPLMLKRTFQGEATALRPAPLEWVSLEEVSPELVAAVVASEDARFRSHRGFDWTEVRRMRKARRAGDGTLRGCSTLSQQTAKNVFTFGTRTLTRKALETWWTVLIELLWGKDRILEVYLNVVETGPGLFGVEAASRHYYGVGARELDLRRAAALAVCLPAPRHFRPDSLDSGRRRALERVMREVSGAGD